MALVELEARMSQKAVRLNSREGLFLLLSHDQVLILRSLAKGRESHYELCHDLFGARYKRDVISNAKRASLSRSLRRLADSGLIERVDTKSIRITTEGKSLIDWLVNDWGYDRIWTHGIKNGIVSERKTLTDCN